MCLVRHCATVFLQAPQTSWAARKDQDQDTSGASRPDSGMAKGGERLNRSPPRGNEAGTRAGLYGLVTVAEGVPFTTVPGAVLYTASTLKAY